MYSNNYHDDKATFEDKYIKNSVSMEKIKLRISESGHPAAVKALKKKLVKVKKLVSDWESSAMHMTRAVIFEPQKYGEGGYSNEYVAQAPLKIQTMIRQHRDQVF